MSDEPLKAVSAWLSRKEGFGGPIGIIVGAFLLAGVILLFFGINPLTVYGEMIAGAFGSLDGITETLLS